MSPPRRPRHPRPGRRERGAPTPPAQVPAGPPVSVPPEPVAAPPAAAVEPVVTPGLGAAQVFMTPPGAVFRVGGGTVHDPDLHQRRIAAVHDHADDPVRSGAAPRADRSGGELHAIGRSQRVVHPADQHAWPGRHHDHAGLGRDRCVWRGPARRHPL